MEMPVKHRRFGVVASALAAYGFTTAVISGPAFAGYVLPPPIAHLLSTPGTAARGLEPAISDGSSGLR